MQDYLKYDCEKQIDMTGYILALSHLKMFTESPLYLK